jgi:hypothetical protein
MRVALVVGTESPLLHGQAGWEWFVGAIDHGADAAAPATNGDDDRGVAEVCPRGQNLGARTELEDC